MTDDLGYEAARAELADVVRRLESGEQSLEESLALWQRGEELADICQRWLDGATARLDGAIAARDAGADAGAGAQTEAADDDRTDGSPASRAGPAATP